MQSKLASLIHRELPLFVLIGLAGQLSACASLPKNELSKSERVLVIAHRGASGYRPEHTRVAYELAAEMGADFIEPDLVMTKDGVLIVRHENEISETTDVAEKFPDRKTKKTIEGQEVSGWFSEDFTLQEIKTLRTRQFEILTFQEVLTLSQELSKKHKRTIGVYPELKHPAYFKSLGFKVEDTFLRDLEKTGMNQADSPVFIQSFELSALQTLKKKTDLPLVFLIGSPNKPPGDHHYAGKKGTYRDYLSFWGFLKLRMTVSTIGPHKSMILRESEDKKMLEPTALIKLAKILGLRVHAYTFQKESEDVYLKFCELGIDGIFTDFPDLTVQALKKCRP